MALNDIWLKNPKQLDDKHIQQIIAFAGKGRLIDDDGTSEEFRAFLGVVSSNMLIRYAGECLKGKFDGSGLALQDIVNQVGRRLGFKVTDGRYRGTQNKIGFDGLWCAPSGNHIIIEVKTTDTYRFDMGTLAGYRRELVLSEIVSEDHSSILIVVGRDDTGELEAQIRGSKYAWDIRLISVDALLRLLKLKEEVEDPKIVGRICNILIPHEYTKVDSIIDMAFYTAEDVQQETDIEAESPGKDRKPKFVPVNFHDACIGRIQTKLKSPLVRRSRATFDAPDGSVSVICSVSKAHDRIFWFAFHPHQKEHLEKGKDAYIAFGCGSSETIFLIPFKQFTQWLDDLNVTEAEDRFYWHVQISKEDNKFVLLRKRGMSRIDLTQYLL